MYAKLTVRSITALGMPAGMALTPMNQSSTEKKGCVRHTATRSRPVAARASLTAAVVTSEPFLANLTMSAVCTIVRNRSAASTSSTVGLEKLTPSAAARHTASTTGA